MNTPHLSNSFAQGFKAKPESCRCTVPLAGGLLATRLPAGTDGGLGDDGTATGCGNVIGTVADRDLRSTCARRETTA